MNLVSTRYAFSSAYLKGEEAKVVAYDHLNGIVQKSKTVPDVLDIIKDTDIGEYLSDSTAGKTAVFEEFDISLWQYMGQSLARFKRFSIPRTMVDMLDVYTKKYDIANIKTALRQTLTGETAPMIPLGEIDRQGRREELSQTKSVEEIAEILTEARLGDYATIIREHIKEKDPRSTFEAEFKMDSTYHEDMMTVLKTMSDGSILAKALGIIIDLLNVHAVFRFALGAKGSPPGEYILPDGHMLTPEVLRELPSLKINEIVTRLEHTQYYIMAQHIAKNFEKEGTITVIDRAIDRNKVRLSRELLSPRALSPCNLLWYLILKETEIRNLRLILKTVLDGIPLSGIRDYLVYAS